MINITSGTLSQVGAQNDLVHTGGVTDRAHIKRVQLCRGRFPAAVQPRDRQRPELVPDLFRIQRMHAVRLFKITRHLREQLVGGNADIDGKAQRVADLVFDSRGRVQREGVIIALGFKDGLRSRHVHVGLVDRSLFHRRGIGF